MRYRYDIFFYINNTMKSEKSHTVGTVPKYNRKYKKYHTVGTVPKSNRKKNTTLSEQFQNPIICFLNTTQSEQFQILIEKNKIYHTVGTAPKSNKKKQNYHTLRTVPNSNSKIVGRGKGTPLAHKYMKPHFRGLVQVHQ
jgi:hypothetical protein